MKGTESILTKYNLCIFCGRQATEQHHLLSGASRNKAEQDGLKIPICSQCHTQQPDSVHRNPKLGNALKILGQLAYESKLGSREDFRKRYGKSYL